MQTEANRDQEKFRAWEAVDNARLRREVKKPHTQQERQQKKAAILPAEQRTREEKIDAFDDQIAIDKTRIEAMQMERADWVHADLLEEKLHQEKHLDDVKAFFVGDGLYYMVRFPSGFPVFRCRT